MIGHTMHALLSGTNIEQKSVAAVKHPRSFLERQLISKGNSISMECQWNSIPGYWWILQIHDIIKPYFESFQLLLCAAQLQCHRHGYCFFSSQAHSMSKPFVLFKLQCFAHWQLLVFQAKCHSELEHWLSQKVWAQVPIHDKHKLNWFSKKSF